MAAEKRRMVIRLAARAARRRRRAVECAFGRVLEARIPLAAVGVAGGAGLRFQFSLWQGGLPMEAVPQQGWLEMPTTDPAGTGKLGGSYGNSECEAVPAFLPDLQRQFHPDGRPAEGRQCG